MNRQDEKKVVDKIVVDVHKSLKEALDNALRRQVHERCTRCDDCIDEVCPKCNDRGWYRT